LRPEITGMDALRAVLPAGTLSGAPKVRAMQIIDELEPHKRGSYGGAIGYLGFTGDLDTAIHIRTVVVKDGAVHVQAGGGTVADLLERRPERLVISPGPCTPADAGVSIEAARAFPEAGVATLGVCLGHQALVEAFGGQTIRGEPIHGKDGEVEHDGKGVLRGL